MSVLYRYRGDTEAILRLVKGLQSMGHSILFVFDGKAPAEKQREITARREAKGEAAATAAALGAFLASGEAAALGQRDRLLLEQTLARSQTESWHMTRDARRAFQDRLWEEKIPYVKSVSEADDVLADLVGANKLDCVISTDMDTLMCGAPRLWIPSRKGDGILEEIVLAEVLEGEGLTSIGFVDACLLCGTEEREGMRGVAPHTAFAWLRHYGTLEGVLRSAIEDTTFRRMFPSVDAIQVARQRTASRPWVERIRADHLDRVRDFLEAL